MQIKTIPPKHVLYFSTRTTLNDLGQYAYVVARRLYAEAARQEQLPAGPIQWLYWDCNGGPDAEFTLEIALPLMEPGRETDEFQCRELPEMTCVASLFTGRWDEMFGAYEKIIAWTKSNGYTLTHHFRESYIHLHPSDHSTEIQIGIQ